MKSNSFQIVVLVVFGALAVLAVLVFSGAIKIGSSNKSDIPGGNVVLWGTWKRDTIIRLFDDLNRTNKSFSVTYIQKNPQTFASDLVEAIASGAGPDMVLISQDTIVATQNKLYHIPYVSFPERSYKDTYTQEGDLFLAPDGVIALPLTIDPIILYYNRNLFEGAGITLPPKTWDEMNNIVPLLTKKDSNNNLIQSALSFGSFTNVMHADDIFSLLLQQAGNPIVAYNGQILQSKLSDKMGLSTSPAESTLTFYTSFIDPNNKLYSWTKTFTNARDAVLSEQLAMYLGYASELPLISAKNPNLNFDITTVPQIPGSNAKSTYGNMYGIAIVKSSKNIATAFSAATLLSGKDFMGKVIGKLLEEAPIAPTRRDMLATPPQNLYGPTLYGSALISRAWLTPSKSVSSQIFSDMIEDVVRGAFSVGDSISKANNRLNVSLQ